MGGSTAGGPITMVVNTQEMLTPGAGDYESQAAKDRQLIKGPNATIGKSVRFARQQSIDSYRSNLPVSHIKDAAQLLKSPPQMGTIGKSKRFAETSEKFTTPGVG